MQHATCHHRPRAGGKDSIVASASLAQARHVHGKRDIQRMPQPKRCGVAGFAVDANAARRGTSRAAVLRCCAEPAADEQSLCSTHTRMHAHARTHMQARTDTRKHVCACVCVCVCVLQVLAVCKLSRRLRRLRALATFHRAAMVAERNGPVACAKWERRSGRWRSGTGRSGRW